MAKILPFIFLTSVFSIFGIFWIIVRVDPDKASWWIFFILIFFIFVSLWGLLGLVLYFLRTKLYRRYSARWYFYTSFKMAFFVALFATIVSSLAVLRLITFLNIGLSILAVSLFALWSYLGKDSSS